MMWLTCLLIAWAVLLGATLLSLGYRKAKYKTGRLLDPTRIMFIGTALSSFALFIPLYHNAYPAEDCGWLERVLLSIHNVIRLFVVDGEFSFVSENMGVVDNWIRVGYTITFAVLFVAAPLLTFGFVLSFFKNISAYKQYITNYNTDTYVFSELNNKSVALATSINENSQKKALFIFTDVFEKQEEASFELVEKARALGAICFQKDILGVNFSLHGKNSEMYFFAIGEDESENINQALKLIEAFKYREKTHLYVFSTGEESEMLLCNAFKNNEENSKAENGKSKPFAIKVRRINEVRSLIYRTLYDCGYENIFKSAREDIDDNKKINAYVIGMGRHGTEMTKALSWFCQMDGYRVEINSFDIDPKAESKFVSLCPELMSPQFNDNYDAEGEARYKIKIHSGVDMATNEFDELLHSLPKATYVFVALGNDEINIAVASKIRMLFERWGCHPKIQAVIGDSDKKEALDGIVNFKNQKYDIDFIGDINSSFSQQVIISSGLEALAKNRHTRWGDEREFWQYDYNYKSSMASAIHREMKKLCGIPGVDKETAERTHDELWGLRILEHRRWNAYMRSEGYVYGGTIERSGRNDLAKTHNCLVPFWDLPEKEQAKDDD